MEFLKEVLSEETFTALSKELDGKKIKLADLSTGDYVSKAKHDESLKNVETLQDELKLRAKDLEELSKKSKPNEEQLAEFEKLKVKYDEDTKSFEERLEKNKLSSALDLAIAKSGTKDDVAVKAHLNDFMSKATVDDKTGVIIGLDSQLAELQKDKTHLFETGGTGAKHKSPAPDKTLEEAIFTGLGVK